VSYPAVFTSSVQCVRIAAGWRSQASDATDQWCETWHFTR